MRASERLVFLVILLALGGLAPACAPIGGSCIPCGESSDPQPLSCPSDDLCFCPASVACNYGGRRPDAGFTAEPCCIPDDDGGMLGTLTRCTSCPAVTVCSFAFASCGAGRCAIGGAACPVDGGVPDAP